MDAQLLIQKYATPVVGAIIKLKAVEVILMAVPKQCYRTNKHHKLRRISSNAARLLRHADGIAEMGKSWRKGDNMTRNSHSNGFVSRTRYRADLNSP